VAVLRKGGVVAFPTETVYGLGADAENERAVRRVFEIKGRPIGHPVIVHLSGESQIELWARNVPGTAYRLTEKFWPGPLTIVLRRSERASDVVTGSQDTVALRAPSHPLAHELLHAFGGGIIAPSANRFGSVSATRAEHVVADLGASVDLIVEGGDATIGVESTIVDLTQGEPAILRPGAVTREAISAALGVPVREGGSDVRVPGSLPSHYAPRARVELAENDVVAAGLANALRAQGSHVSVIGSDDVNALARDLYERLRAADREGVDAIVVVLPANEGLGVALRDRLRRAASPKR